MSFLSRIEVDNEASYCKPLLTFDVDWAHDFIIEDTLSLVDHYSVKSTWMMTHSTDMESRIRKSGHEIGIHPNFNPLLMGDRSKGISAEHIVADLLTQFPDSKSVRSHSLVQSSRLSQLFYGFGLRFESNDYLPGSVFSSIQPFIAETGMIKVPYIFSDELTCLSDHIHVSTLCEREGLKVFDFHPIHVFLNTESLERYERTRSLHNNPKELSKFRYDGFGTRNRLIELLQVSENL